MADVSCTRIKRSISMVTLIALFCIGPLCGQSPDGAPVADAGLSRYAARDPVVLDGTGSYGPDDSVTLSYMWRQISGPPVQISEADIANPTLSKGF